MQGSTLKNTGNCCNMNTYIQIKQCGKHVMLLSYSICYRARQSISCFLFKLEVEWEWEWGGAIKKKDIVVWCFVFMADGARESGAGFTGFGRVGGDGRGIDVNSWNVWASPDNPACGNCQAGFPVRLLVFVWSFNQNISS